MKIPLIFIAGAGLSAFAIAAKRGAPLDYTESPQRSYSPNEGPDAIYSNEGRNYPGAISYPQPDVNLYAFLETIGALESGNNYSALVGGGNFYDYSDHPANTGEFGGIRRGDDGRLTTAAGRFQITQTTWNSLGGASRYGSFDQGAQIQAAIDLIARRGALSAVENGDVITARALLSNEWEALAINSPEKIVSMFVSNGGYV